MDGRGVRERSQRYCQHQSVGRGPWGNSDESIVDELNQQDQVLECQAFLAPTTVLFISLPCTQMVSFFSFPASSFIGRANLSLCRLLAHHHRRSPHAKLPSTFFLQLYLSRFTSTPMQNDSPVPCA